MRKIAAADARGTRPQGLDRHHHSSRKEYPRERRKKQRADQNESCALDRSYQRLIGLLDRKLHEHGPAQRGDRREGCQHFPSLDVGRGFDLLRWAAFFRALRRLNLRKFCHIRIAQNQADVRMRDEAALRVNHVSLPALANLNLGDDVPDQLKIDFRDADAGVATRAGERQRHIRFGLRGGNRPGRSKSCF